MWLLTGHSAESFGQTYRASDQGRNQKFISGAFSYPFSFPFRSLSFPASNWPLKSSQEIWGALLAPPAEENDNCSHQTRSLGSKYTKMRLRLSPGHERILVY